MAQRLEFLLAHHGAGHPSVTEVIRCDSLRPLALLVTTMTAVVRAQESPDPRAAQPERPTVATHAYAVAPGYAEIEAGWERDRNADGSSAWVVPLFLKIGLTRGVQLGLLVPLVRPVPVGLGPGDVSVATKLRITTGHPFLADAALLAAIKLPTGSGDHGTGTTDATIMFISSRQIGAVGLDLNASYTRRSGDGSASPINSTMVTAAAGWTLAGPVGMTLELYAYPRTSGPAGAPTTAALLGGPTYRLNPRCVLDLGAIAKLAGSQPFALYGGVTYNMGSFR